MRKANKSRGEVAVTLGGVPLILCATMENLDALEQATDLGLTDLMRELAGFKLSVLKYSVQSLVVEGDADKAFAGLDAGVGWAAEVQSAIMSALVPDKEGNAEAEAETP